MVSAATVPIGIYGSDGAADPGGRGCGLWPTGYTGAVSAAGGVPVVIRPKSLASSLDATLDRLAGIGLADRKAANPKQAGGGTQQGGGWRGRSRPLRSACPC